jgi:hypothetical protein
LKHGNELVAVKFEFSQKARLQQVFAFTSLRKSAIQSTHLLVEEDGSGSSI